MRTLRFAKETGDHLDESEKIIHRDANGVVLQAGDNVVLIKDLKSKRLEYELPSKVLQFAEFL